jgi:hypothetical protein
LLSTPLIKADQKHDHENGNHGLFHENSFSMTKVRQERFAGCSSPLDTNNPPGKTTNPGSIR